MGRVAGEVEPALRVALGYFGDIGCHVDNLQPQLVSNSIAVRQGFRKMEACLQKNYGNFRRQLTDEMQHGYAVCLEG
ncbi:MAG: hypothetical protein R2795_10120 [Saprospiraceae bacterium]